MLVSLAGCLPGCARSPRQLPMLREVGVDDSALDAQPESARSDGSALTQIRGECRDIRLQGYDGQARESRNVSRFFRAAVPGARMVFLTEPLADDELLDADAVLAWLNGDATMPVGISPLRYEGGNPGMWVTPGYHAPNEELMLWVVRETGICSVPLHVSSARSDGAAVAWVWPQDGATTLSPYVWLGWDGEVDAPRISQNESIALPEMQWVCAPNVVCARYALNALASTVGVGMDVHDATGAVLPSRVLATYDRRANAVGVAGALELVATECDADEQLYQRSCMRADADRVGIRGLLNREALVLAAGSAGLHVDVVPSRAIIAAERVFEAVLPRTTLPVHLEAFDVDGRRASGLLRPEVVATADAEAFPLQIAGVTVAMGANPSERELVVLQNTSSVGVLVERLSLCRGTTCLDVPEGRSLAAGQTWVLVAPTFDREQSGVAPGIALDRLSRWFSAAVSRSLAPIALRTANGHRVDEVAAPARAGCHIRATDRDLSSFAQPLRPVPCVHGLPAQAEAMR